MRRRLPSPWPALLLALAGAGSVAMGVDGRAHAAGKTVTPESTRDKDPGTPGATATATATAPGAAAGEAARPADPAKAPADADRRIDVAMRHAYAHRDASASGELYGIWKLLPETDLRRDTVAFQLAATLDRLGYTQAAAEHYTEIVSGRRSPELVNRALAALEDMVRRRLVNPAQLVDRVLFGNQYGDVPGKTGEFVDYSQGLGELRAGFSEWGQRRLRDLEKSGKYYNLRARYTLAVLELERGNHGAAETLFHSILDDKNTPKELRNEARQALARELYRDKQYDDAFKLYADIDSPIALQDTVLVEQAWDRVAVHDEPRALGMVVGLGAPVYRTLFGPERRLIQALALKRLCQFRPAHLAVDDFRSRYAALLRQIRDGQPLEKDPDLRDMVKSHDELLPGARLLDLLIDERQRAHRASDRDLARHLDEIYGARLAAQSAEVNRNRPVAYQRLAEELLRIDEQLTILDYEIGAQLFKSVHDEGQRARIAKIPFGSDRVYYRFAGEYWSDELRDFEVRAEDRCLR